MRPEKARKRSRLSEAQVVEIFLSKATKLGATKICVRFGISEKAVRDIWTGRTWAKETMHLVRMRQTVETRTIGRPIDGAGKRPRNRKAGFEEQSAFKSSEIEIGLARERPASVGSSEAVRQDTCSFFSSRILGCNYVETLDDQLYDWKGVCSAEFLQGFLNYNEESAC